MTLGWGSGKKKARGTGSGYRITQEPAPLSGAERLRRVAVLVAFIVLVGAVTQRLTPVKDVVDFDVDTQSIAPDTIQAEFGFETIDLQATRKAHEEAAATVPRTYDVDEGRVRAQLQRFGELVEALVSEKDGLEKAVTQALLASDSSESEGEVVAKATLAYATERHKDPPFDGFSSPALLAVWLTPNPASIPKRQVAQAPPVRQKQPAAEPEPPHGEEAQGPAADASDAGAAEEDAKQTAPEAPRPTKGLKRAKNTPFEYAYVDRLREIARAGLEYTLTYGVLKQGERAGSLTEDPERKIVVLRSNPLGNQSVSEEFSLADAPILSNGRHRLDDWIREGIQALASEEAEAPLDWTSLQGAAMDMAGLALSDTLGFDEVTTEGAREAAIRDTPPVMKRIQPNEEIQRGGRPWTEQSRSDFQTYMAKKLSGQEPAASIVASFVSHMILVALVLACLVRSMTVLTSKRGDPYQSLNLALLMVCAMLVVGRVISYFDPTGFLVPATAGAILMAILAHARLAAMTSLLTAVLLSVQYNYNWQVLVLGTAMSFAGLLSTYAVRRRSDMGNASVKATAVGLVTMLALTLATGSLFTEAALRSLGLVAFNGLVCLSIVPALLSPLERLFGVTTDIQLLEYSDLNNDVLSRLAKDVPATHAHSLRVGELAEAACDAIGANGLLARVCAFYHDIGKLKRPQYFSENQTGANVHDELSPRLSARAIASHVTEGADTAREFHLPKPIVDGILEHHGTCMISFFYQEAVAQQKHGDVREDDFRYPGPKPQSRETAILMICDAAESSVRALKNANEERVRELVDKIISSRAADRQFDECHLTLKELDTIGQVVARRVLSNLHRRIEYPDEAVDKPAANVIPMSGRPGS